MKPNFAQFAPSYYESSVTRPPPRAALTDNASADVCVIGGGISGLSCALNLAESGRSVVLLEAAQVGWGASGRSGGQIIHGYSRGDFARPAAQAGVSEKDLFAFSTLAIDNVRERIARHQIDCDWQSGFAAAAVSARDYAELQREAERMNREYDYEFARAVPMHRFREIVSSRIYHGGLLDDNSGHLHPLKYTLGLAQAAEEAGAQIYERSPVARITQLQNGCEVVVGGDGEAGKTVRCAQVVVACNAYNYRRLGGIAARIMPVGTYIGATPPLGREAANLITDGRSVCDTRFVLDYYRVSADTRLLFGGRVSYSAFTPANLRRTLRARMTKVFPQLGGVDFDYVWGGYVAITQTRFPDIGRAGARVYYAQGYSGHGMALSGFAGMTIARAIVGDSERLDVFHRIRHRDFPGGDLLRMPILVLAMTYYRLRDLL